MPILPNTVTKIPKLKKGDRIKLVDKPDMLVVVPLTKQASQRYGHKTEWCISTDSDSYFVKTNKVSVIIFVLLYNVKEDSKRGDAHLKIALTRRLRGRDAKKWYAWDMSDNPFDYEVTEYMIKDKHNALKLINNYYNKRFEEEKIIYPQFHLNVGDVIKCLGNKKIDINYTKYDEDAWKKHLKKKTSKYKKGKWYKEHHFVSFYYSIDIKKHDIVKAEVVKVLKTSIMIKVIEVVNLNEDYKFLVETFPPIIRISMKVDKSVEIIKKFINN